jgi:type 1 glutamine amidotransferase
VPRKNRGALPINDADRRARCARYDAEPTPIEAPAGKLRVLIFEKINGFKDEPSVRAAQTTLRALAGRMGWGVAVTDKGGAVTAANLRHFDVVVWNNVSGDVLTLTQRRALRHYVERGGGFVALHGSGGDTANFWDWYAQSLIGARFLGHPMSPQFQTARVVIDDAAHPVAQGLPAEWSMKDEWYSFRSNPRDAGSHVVARIDEASFKPGRALEMGDHPIAWTRCVGRGRSFYSAIGHRPDAYADPNHLKLLEQAIVWAAGAGDASCAPNANP